MGGGDIWVYLNLGIHDVINHSENFVDPNDSFINTQRIERLWRSLKEEIPKGCHSSTRKAYIMQFYLKKS